MKQVISVFQQNQLETSTDMIEIMIQRTIAEMTLGESAAEDIQDEKVLPPTLTKGDIVAVLARI